MKAAHKVWDICWLGLHSLTVHKARSALTTLGIVFGVWSVIAMLAINEGASYEAQQSLRRLGSTNIIVESIKPSEGGLSDRGSRTLEYGLKHADVRRLRDNIPGVQKAAVVHRTPKRARVANRFYQVSVIGTDPAYREVVNIRMVRGRFLTAADYLRARSHCVVTSSLARKLFYCEDPVGRQLWLGLEVFTVVGVIRNLPRAIAGGESDVGNYAIIPLTTDMDRFGKVLVFRTAGSRRIEEVEVSQCILQMEDDQSVLDGAAIARSLLERFHERGDYEVIVPLELIEQKRKQAQLWNFMFMTIASVSMVVGGIGIMNIMLASVTERTREIGVRRAMGAKQRDIIVQFLIEAVTLTTAGGLIGIAVGTLLPWVVSSVLKLTTIITPIMLVLPLVMAVVVGLASGIYPAMRAAKLDPIVALRHE